MGRVRVIHSLLTIANAEASGQRFIIAQNVNPNAFLIWTGDLLGMLRYTALTSLTACDFGFANLTGIADDPDAFNPDLDIHLAGSSSFIPSPTIAKGAQPLWQLAGLSESPMGLMDLTMTTNAIAGAAGSVFVELLLASK
jgi:hypothetical protein